MIMWHWSWSFDITEINYISNVLKKETAILNYNNISHYFCFYCIFDQINADLVSIKISNPAYPKQRFLNVWQEHDTRILV